MKSVNCQVNKPKKIAYMVYTGQPLSKEIRKVVVVEDDPTLQYMYKLKLEHQGFKVETANDGQAGLKVIEQFRPDIVLLDLRMPIMNGDVMLARLRQHDWA